MVGNVGIPIWIKLSSIFGGLECTLINVPPCLFNWSRYSDSFPENKHWKLLLKGIEWQFDRCSSPILWQTIYQSGCLSERWKIWKFFMRITREIHMISNRINRPGEMFLLLNWSGTPSAFIWQAHEPSVVPQSRGLRSGCSIPLIAMTPGLILKPYRENCSSVSARVQFFHRTY